jgi:hypothetical protein
MRLFKTLLLSSILFFQSCEILEKSSETDENNQSKTEETKDDGKLVETKPVQPKNKKLPEPPKLEPIVEKKKTNEAAGDKPSSKPEKAAFTPELLAAVKNWNAIPKSVFPLNSVTIKKDLKFTAYSQTGQAIGSSQLPAGKEVIALGHKGDLLTVSPSKRGTMRATIAMNQTDFKEGVAYLFELRKRQRIAYADKKSQESKNVVSRTIDSSKLKSKPSSKSKQNTPLFDDLPTPGDYGHGKFCICSDCRTKRLAQTGSIK